MKLTPQQRVKLTAKINSLSHAQLKELRDNVKAPYNLRRAASNMLTVQQVDQIRQNYQR